MNKIRLETERLYLEEAEASDIPFILDMENHEDNRDFIWQGTKEEHLFEIQEEDTLLWIVRSRDNLEKVGYFLGQIDRRSRRFELRRIAMDKKGVGYGREVIEALMKHAFEKEDINRFWLDVYPENHIGIGLYESLHMQKEGVLRQNYRTPKGIYKDQIIYALLLEEWLSLNLQKELKGEKI